MVVLERRQYLAVRERGHTEAREVRGKVDDHIEWHLEK